MCRWGGRPRLARRMERDDCGLSSPRYDARAAPRAVCAGARAAGAHGGAGPLPARGARLADRDSLVSLATNLYSVPCRLIGQRVEVQRRGDTVQIFPRDREVATHPVIPGHHQFRILPEHGPGAIARTVRQRQSTPHRSERAARTLPEVDAISRATRPCSAPRTSRRCPHEPPHHSSDSVTS